MTVKEFELYSFDGILNDVKSLYFFNLNVDKRFWQQAEYDFFGSFSPRKFKDKGA